MNIEIPINVPGEQKESGEDTEMDEEEPSCTAPAEYLEGFRNRHEECYDLDNLCADCPYYNPGSYQ